MEFISTYRLKCTCPARQSVYDRVDVTVTLDGGLTWLAAESGWTYVGTYTPMAMLRREASSNVYIWGKDYDRTIEPEKGRRYLWLDSDGSQDSDIQQFTKFTYPIAYKTSFHFCINR